MSASSGLTMLVGLLAASVLQAAVPQFPYKAFVNRNEVQVRSGPGDEYYPTDKLKIGAEVEIYRHDPGGWYAIRPPEGSFAWVSGRYLDVQKNRLAKVTAERVAARVGSRFSDIRDVIQVRLNKGEVVEVLEAVSAAEGRERTTWYKIAPPAGEFRWIFGKYVDPEYPRDGLGKATIQTTSAPTAAGTPPAATQPPAIASPAAQPANAPAASTPAAAAAPAAATAAQEASGAAMAPADPARPLAVPAMRQLSPEEYQAQLDEIELKLSVMLAEEPSVWSFEQLKPRAHALLEQAQTAVERGRARLLVNKVARYEDLKQRSDAVRALGQQAQQRSQQLADLGRQRAAQLPKPDDRFDGVGRLTRVVAQGSGSPRYALVEPDGQVRCYVSPAPGVNLQYYVGREVGVNGVRGYIPDQRAHHVMAKHVTPIDDTRLR